MKLIFESGTFRFAIAALGLLLLTTSSAETSLSSTGFPVAVAGAQTGDAAPMITVTDITGKEFSIADNVAAGRPAVVYFMASWCPICATNWEALSAVVPKYEGKVDFIAISIDPTDTLEVLQELAEQKDFQFRTSPGNVDAMMQFGVTAQTAKFAIDKNGNVVYRHDGALSEAEWDYVFAQLGDG